MTPQDIKQELEKIFKDKALKKELGLSKTDVYNLRHDRVEIGSQLKVLYQAGRLKIK